MSVYPEVDAHGGDEAPGQKGSIFKANQQTGLPNARVPHQHHLRRKTDRRRTALANGLAENLNNHTPHTHFPQNSHLQRKQSVTPLPVGKRQYRPMLKRERERAGCFFSFFSSDVTHLRTVCVCLLYPCTALDVLHVFYFNLAFY